MPKQATPALRAAAISVLLGIVSSVALSQQPGAKQVDYKIAPTIHVGDGTVSGARLQPYENAWLMSVHFRDGRILDQGIWSDLLRLRDVDGGSKVYVRIQGMTYQKGLTSVTVNVFDPVSLAPISSEQHGPDGRVVKRMFNGAHVETHVTPPGGSERVSQAELPMPVYDFNGGMYGVLFAAQKLKTGATGALPAIAEFTDDFESVPYKVIGQERIRAGSRGDVDAWVVEVGTPTTLKFWISERAPYIIRLVLPNFVPEGDVVYEMLS